MGVEDVVIVAATRTPIGNLCGVFSTVKAHELGAAVIRSAIEQANLRATDVTEVVMGQSLQAGQGQNPVRQAAMAAELGIGVPAYSINMLCGSGLKAVALAYQAVLADPQQIIVAGGQESMSSAPHVRNLRIPTKLGNVEFIDSMLHDGLTDAFHNVHMGLTAENVAQKYSITRAEQDALAAESQRRVQETLKNGLFDKEITPVTTVVNKKCVIVDKDEYPRPDTSLESLSKLRPAFSPTGSVTAGNASGVNDGAAVLIVTSRSVAVDKSLPIRARIIGFAQGCVEPIYMGLGPIPAIQNLLKKIGWCTNDVDLFEINEAFAVVSCAVMRDLEIDASKVNVNGGAVALGHPIGASGARVLVTLLHALEQRNLKRGIAALCIGGGMGIAMAVERN